MTDPARLEAAKRQAVEEICRFTVHDGGDTCDCDLVALGYDAGVASCTSDRVCAQGHAQNPEWSVCFICAAFDAGVAQGQSAILHELNQAHGVAQALEQQLRHANECWEPGHTYSTEPPYVEERRQTRVHCVMCTDAAMARAKAAGVAQERLRAVGLCLNPYGDDVQAMAGDEPFAVGRKIAAALRAPSAPSTCQCPEGWYGPHKAPCPKEAPSAPSEGE